MSMSFLKTLKTIARNPVSSVTSLVRTVKIPDYLKTVLAQGKSDTAALLKQHSFDENAYTQALKNPKEIAQSFQALLEDNYGVHKNPM